MDLKKYQRHALTTSAWGTADDPESALLPLLGLASTAGAIVNIYYRYLRDSIDLEENKYFLRVKLGDLLWYLAVFAKALGLELEDIADANLGHARQRYGKQALRGLDVLDRRFPKRERFPRRFVVRFSQYWDRHHRRRASLRLIEAAPNAFPAGPITMYTEDGPKTIGYEVGGRLGAEITDNTRRADGYRFHDAIHMGFVAVLGWSPTMRALLRVKRKSDLPADESEDGARAVFVDEGLAALLFRLSRRRGSFLSEPTITGDVLEVVTPLISTLEVERMPEWLWRRAIQQGFAALQELHQHGGGFLVADLDKRTLEYRKVYGRRSIRRAAGRRAARRRRERGRR